MDYTTLVTSEHRSKPNFMAVVDALCNGAGSITTTAQSIAALFDLDSSVGDQLDILGQWIGQSRDIPNSIAINYFGFSDNPNAATFGEVGNSSVGGPFYDLGQSTGSSALLDDATYRTVLKAKILSNQFDGSTPALEAALQLIAGVPFAIYDPGTLVVAIVLSAAVSSVTQALLSGIDLLPRPGGVQYVPMFPLAQWTWAVTGTATASGTTAQKATGAAAWDSSAYDATTYPVIAMTWTVPATTDELAGGLASTPTADPTNTIAAINYGFETDGTGGAYVSEGGTQVGSRIVIAAGDTFTVYSDGVNVVYLHNGQIVRVTAVSAGSFAPMFAFYTVGGSVTGVSVAT